MAWAGGGCRVGMEDDLLILINAELIRKSRLRRACRLLKRSLRVKCRLGARVDSYQNCLVSCGSSFFSFTMKAHEQP